MQKKRLLTGLQPSGKLHLGNYFGALRPFADICSDYDSFLMVADYHALTTVRDPELLRRNIYDTVKDYLAAGIDPQKVVIFRQSDVPQHMELAWIFECLVTIPFLMQAHAYKDKVAKGIEANAGLFNYPMLMAADILLYDTQVVPVGEDQRQHIEYAREAATKFNNAYSDTFTMPEEKILQSVGTVPGIDGQKMSKSYKNTIPLLGTNEEITKAVMSIVTDSQGDKPHNVYTLHSLFKSESELEPLYEEHRGKYGELKNILAQDILTHITPMRDVRDTLTDGVVQEILADGAAKAQKIAGEKMNSVRQTIGIAL